ncbi:hypothetical protein MTO98_25675 [Mucilaginibacter sp. SMC90]|uniref:hypothetical protein n=1 Tax=Mucilaginibacter sp. SMC90 TaxID=2929803 RepID=UPI001FB25926|nr:hypothetical protein [Mucilaginibacter sp. SMC90]UOE47804.1 hypothetical protein MTO98_25675 [Mucilaginibacter sp. SMC90]
MKNKLFFIRTSMITVTVILLAWDMLLWLSKHTETLPHRDLLLTCVLLWIVSIFFPQQNDDDWVGQF